jgi:Flp pilus assembly protein TadG
MRLRRPRARKHKSSKSREVGQATIEFALLLPMVALVFLLGVDGILLARDQLLVVHAAREGARRAALTGSVGEATQVVHARGAPTSASVSLTSYGGAGSPDELVGITVRWKLDARLVVLGRLGRLGRGISVEHTVVMRREQDSEQNTEQDTTQNTEDSN